MRENEQAQYDVIIVGGGAAGMMAAGRAGECGARVLLLEKMASCGKKILVSGKTRCNLTNTAPLEDFIPMYGANGRFLYSAFHHFFRAELLTLLERYSLTTKQERGGRIFPVSDSAGDVVRALSDYLADSHVQIKFRTRVTAIKKVNDIYFDVQTFGGHYRAKAVLLTTGGASWPQTGSAGDGYKMVAALGHTIIKLMPALVPLLVEEINIAKAMDGVNLRNIRATVFKGRAQEIDAALTPQTDYGRGGKKVARLPVIESRFGEMLFTSFGLAGPVILLMSLAVAKAILEDPVSILVDLKPALTREQLRRRLQKDFDSAGKKKINAVMQEYLPGKMVDHFVALTGIDPKKQAHQITAGEKDKIIELLKALRFNIKSPLPLAKAMVTAGGVALNEIQPQTMASKLVPGLYFGGEVIDIDADTGGYNLQAAFSTGYLAGENAAKYALALSEA